MQTSKLASEDNYRTFNACVQANYRPELEVGPLLRWTYEIFTPDLEPNIYYKGAKAYIKAPGLQELADCMRAISQDYYSATSYHSTRIRARNLIGLILLPVIAFVSALSISLFFDSALQYLRSLYTGPLHLAALCIYWLALPLTFIVVVKFWKKIIRIAVDAHFADSLCCCIVSLLVIDLSFPDALNHPQRRKRLHRRIGSLYRMVKLLPETYRSASSQGRIWTSNYAEALGNKMLLYEKKIVASSDETLSFLRDEALLLYKSFFSQNLRAIAWEDELQDVAPQPRGKRDLFLALAIALLTIFLASSIIFLGVFPDQVVAKVISTILPFTFALILILTDSLFRLGISETVISLYKKIREL